MSDDPKLITGSLASHMMDAMEGFCRLEAELREYKWRLCYQKDFPIGYTHTARKHCRDILKALEMIDHLIDGEALRRRQQSGTPQ
jgi:hypothetical protein